MTAEQTSYAGGDVVVIVNTIDSNGNHIAAVIDPATTLVDGRAEQPTVEGGAGIYKLTFSALNPPTIDGEKLLVRVNGTVSGVPWTEYAIPVIVEHAASDTAELVKADAQINTNAILAAIGDLKGDGFGYPVQVPGPTQLDAAIGGNFFSTRVPERLVNLDGNTALVGDRLQSWATEDGTTVLTAVNSGDGSYPRLINVPGESFPFVDFSEGECGFEKIHDPDSNPLDSISEGSFVCHFRGGVDTSARQVLGMISAINSSGTRCSFEHWNASPNRNSDYAAYTNGGSSVRAYGSNGALCRDQTVGRVFYTSRGGSYDIRTGAGQNNVTGTNDGYFHDDFPGFDRRAQAIAHHTSTVKNSWFTGAIAYLGYFPNTVDLDDLEAELEYIWPTRFILIGGDSRMNTDATPSQWQKVSNVPMRELTTGGNTITGAAAELLAGDGTSRTTDLWFYAGVNDYLGGATATTMLADLEQALIDIRAAWPYTRIHLFNDSPAGGTTTWTAAKGEQGKLYSQGLREIAQRYEGVYVFDSWGTLEDPDNLGYQRAEYTTDGTHHTVEAYEALMTRLAPLVDASQYSEATLTGILAAIGDQNDDIDALGDLIVRNYDEILILGGKIDDLAGDVANITLSAGNASESSGGYQTDLGELLGEPLVWIECDPDLYAKKGVKQDFTPGVSPASIINLGTGADIIPIADPYLGIMPPVTDPETGGIRWQHDGQHAAATDGAIAFGATGTIVYAIEIDDTDAPNAALTHCGGDGAAVCYHQSVADTESQNVSAKIVEITYDTARRIIMDKGRHIVALVWGPNATNVRLYVDGTMAQTTNLQALDLATEFAIGALASDAVGFKGFSHAFAHWDRDFTDEEVLIATNHLQQKYQERTVKAYHVGYYGDEMATSGLFEAITAWMTRNGMELHPTTSFGLSGAGWLKDASGQAITLANPASIGAFAQGIPFGGRNPKGSIVFVDGGLNDKDFNIPDQQAAYELAIPYLTRRGVTVVLITPTPYLGDAGFQAFKHEMHDAIVAGEYTTDVITELVTTDPSETDDAYPLNADLITAPRLFNGAKDGANYFAELIMNDVRRYLETDADLLLKANDQTLAAAQLAEWYARLAATACVGDVDISDPDDGSDTLILSFKDVDDNAIEVRNITYYKKTGQRVNN